MKFRIFPEEGGRGWDLDVVRSYEGEKEEIDRAPFTSAGAARRAVRTMKSKLAAAPIEVLEVRPDDAHQDEED